MTSNLLSANARLSARFHNVFKPRDLFLHDGKSLRRFTIGAKVQMAAASAVFLLLAWSLFATFTAVSAMNGDVAQMQRRVTAMEADVAAMRTAVTARAETLARRQQFLEEMMSGNASVERLAAELPQAAPEPTNAAAQAMSDSFDEVEGMQTAMVERAQQITRQRYRQTAATLRQLGLTPTRFHQARAIGMGGPYEPVPTAADNADPRFLALFTSWRALEQLQSGVSAIPSARPIQASVNFTSGFGVRSDPFRGRAAMHGGIDLAGAYGTPVYATADGIIGRSEWNNGGYGNLVEIDHGQGIQTRYGHLSRRIAVPGQRVRRGELIGLMGSTGRSTGNHLHYEVRIDGRAVNPIPFMTQPTVVQVAVRPATAAAVGGPTTAAR
ncbi:MAG TPA: M23 family metallopeptidase [Allosphingosinicella sp.]